MSIFFLWNQLAVAAVLRKNVAVTHCKAHDTHTCSRVVGALFIEKMTAALSAPRTCCELRAGFVHHVEMVILT